MTFCLAVAVKQDTGMGSSRPLFLRQRLHEAGNVEVVHAKIVPPGRKAVRLVDDEPLDVAPGKDFEDSVLDRSCSGAR